LLGLAASGPSDLDRYRGSWSCQDYGRAVLRPITRARMNFPNGTKTVFEFHPDRGPDGVRISSGGREFYPQTRFTVCIVEQLRSSSTLAYEQVGSAVVIIIGYGSTALFPVNLYTAFLAGKWLEAAFAIASQKQSASGIAPGILNAKGKEVLRQEQIFSSIPIEVGHTKSEHGTKLSLGRQGFYIKVTLAI
jgi:hypothetical protein